MYAARRYDRDHPRRKSNFGEKDCATRASMAPYCPIAGREEGKRDCGKVSFNMKVSPFPFFPLSFFFRRARKWVRMLREMIHGMVQELRDRDPNI